METKGQTSRVCKENSNVFSGVRQLITLLKSCTNDPYQFRNCRHRRSHHVSTTARDSYGEKDVLCKQ